MIVVADTGPLNYLLLIAELKLLRELHGHIVLPETVQREMLHPAAPEIVKNWALSPPDWVEVRRATALLSFAGLSPGETEAISLALEMSPSLLLIDERKGRRIATEQGLAVSGTLVTLELAAQTKKIVLTEAIERLRRTNFHVSEIVLQEMQERDRKRREVSE